MGQVRREKVGGSGGCKSRPGKVRPGRVAIRSGGGGSEAVGAWETAAAKGRPPEADRHRRQRRDGPESPDAKGLFRRCGGAWRAAHRLARRDGRPPPRVGRGWNTRFALAAGPGSRRKNRMFLIAQRACEERAKADAIQR